MGNIPDDGIEQKIAEAIRDNADSLSLYGRLLSLKSLSLTGGVRNCRVSHGL